MEERGKTKATEKSIYNLWRASLILSIFMVKNSTYVLGVRHFLLVGQSPSVWPKGLSLSQLPSLHHHPRLLQNKNYCNAETDLSAFKVRPSALR